MTFLIIPERLDDAALNGPLLDRTFGHDRWQKTVYRLRVGAPPAALSFSAVNDEGSLLGSLRFWPVAIGDSPAILLGPLAVEPTLQGQGIGKSLVTHGLARARDLGHRVCLVVGAAGYYRPFGFTSAAAAGIILPGPVEPERFQVAGLVPGGLEGVSGVVARPGAVQAA